MAAERMPRPVQDESDLAQLLDEATTEPIRLERHGIVYRLERESSTAAWTGYDPEAVHATLSQSTPLWSEQDADGLIAALRQARDDGSRPPLRP